MKKILVIGVFLVLIITLVAFGIHPVTEPLPDIKIGVYAGSGANASSVKAIENSLGSFPELCVERVQERDVRQGGLRDCQVLIMPEGSAEEIRQTLGKDGCRNIEKFVAGGGGYMGIGGGASLATLGWNEDMKDIQLINADIASASQNQAAENSNASERIKCIALLKGGSSRESFDIVFSHGPVFLRGANAYLPEYISLAQFGRGDPADARDAIIAAPFGLGRVLLFSPLPEQTPGLETMLAQAVRWSAGMSEPQTKALGPDFSWEGIFGISSLLPPSK